MYRFLARPRWILAALAVTVISVTFVNLGLWQLDRHRQVVADNQIRAQRLASDVGDITVFLQAAGRDIDTLEFRRTVAIGVFDASAEVLLRGQARAGSPGFDVLTPLLLEDGTTILVDRGWVPLAFDTPPVAAAPPPEGTVEVMGVIRSSQRPAVIGPTEPDGPLTQVARVDLERLSEQFPRLAPVWIEVTSDDPPMGSPRTGPLPDLTDDGPHLEYAVQWFAFALVGIVGFGFVIRRAGHRASER